MSTGYSFLSFGLGAKSEPAEAAPASNADIDMPVIINESGVEVSPIDEVVATEPIVSNEDNVQPIVAAPVVAAPSVAAPAVAVKKEVQEKKVRFNVNPSARTLKEMKAAEKKTAPVVKQVPLVKQVPVVPAFPAIKKTSAPHSPKAKTPVVSSKPLSVSARRK